jgi:peptidoglycan-N-acetylglucosamine deacetylase
MRTDGDRPGGAPAPNGREASRRMLIVGGGVVVLGAFAFGWRGGRASESLNWTTRVAVQAGPREQVGEGGGAGGSAGSGQKLITARSGRDGRSAATGRSGSSGRDGRGGVSGDGKGRAPKTTDGVPAEPMYYVDDGPKVIALTIDDGPSPVYTPQILRLLAKYRVTAAFSMIGENASYYPGVARDVADAGHMIVNHTWDHADLTLLGSSQVRTEIVRASEAIEAASGVRPHMFRAPYGAWSRTSLDYCASMGLTPLDWSVDPRDWSRPGVGSIVSTIMGTTHTGSIILEHDGGGNRSQTVAALKIVIPRLLGEGYRFQVP